MSPEGTTDKRFEFGANWKKFLGHLDRGQTNSRSRIHGLKHVANQLLEIVSKLGYWLRRRIK